MGQEKKTKKTLKKNEYQALRSLLLNQKVDWETLFDLFQKRSLSVNNLLMSVDFFNAVTDCYNLNYSQIVFFGFFVDDEIHLSAHVPYFEDEDTQS